MKREPIKHISGLKGVYSVIDCRVGINGVLHLVVEFNNGRIEEYAFGEGDLDMYQKIKNHELGWNAWVRE